MEEGQIVGLLKRLNHLLDGYGRNLAGQRGISQSQCVMLWYLLDQRGRTVCATDIHLVFEISKASISTVLKGLKKEGYLNLVSVPGDDRKKQIVLTEKAYEAEKAIREGMGAIQEHLFLGIGEAELQVVERSLARMIENLKSKDHKEVR